jgi:DNA mismatch repair protein MutS
MKPVVFNPVAVDDLEEIVSYIRQDNAMAAEAVRHDILDTAESLAHQPDLGVRPRFSAPRFAGIRFLPSQQYPNYLLFTVSCLTKSKFCACSTVRETFHLCSIDAMREWNHQIIFLHKILPGSAEKSDGIQVARLASLPENVIDRAKEVLQQLESGHQPAESVKEVPVATGVPAKTRKKPRSDEDAGQMSLFG